MINFLVMFFMALLSTCTSGKKMSSWDKALEQTMVESVFGLGVVRSQAVFEYKPSLSYRLEDVFVHEGQEVKAGQSLVKLELGPVVRSPIDGLVTRVLFFKGESVFPQSLVVRVEDPKRLWIDVSLDQKSFAKVKPGQKVDVRIEGFSERWTGEVLSRFFYEGQFYVRITAKDLDRFDVLPGMSAECVIEVGRFDKALVVPLAAVQEGGLVRRRRGGKESVVSVQLGVRSDSWVQVLSGDVQVGDEVFVEKK